MASAHLPNPETLSQPALRLKGRIFYRPEALGPKAAKALSYALHRIAKPTCPREEAEKRRVAAPRQLLKFVKTSGIGPRPMSPDFTESLALTPKPSPHHATQDLEPIT